MAKKIPLHRLRNMTKERSIRRAYVPLDRLNRREDLSATDLPSGIAFHELKRS